MIAEVSELVNYGALGVLAIVLISAIVYQAKLIEKKDDQLSDLQKSTVKMLADLSNVVNSIDNSTSNIPKEVREVLKDDFIALSTKIENCNK